MKEKKDIRLFAEAFNRIKWKNDDKLSELSDEMKTMKRIIESHLAKIKENFPNLTDHSLKHSNMLWEYADIIVGVKENYLNPIEVFILNSVFLLHDAGMCYSLLYRKEEIKTDSIYLDYIKINKGTIEKEKLEEEALFYTIRENHGMYALRIAKELLPTEEYFISRILYRDEFADFIGKIAMSHARNIIYIEREFGTSYTSPRFPKEWSIDFKKIAYVLRVSDAADIDNLRTPKTIKMIAEIKGDSKEHWTFQKKLGFPSLERDGYLLYSTNNPFIKSEQKAWWYCYNALKVLDDELKNASNYFASKSEEGFAAKSVKYINDTLALGKNSIRTVGWDSINTSIRVSNPVHIAAELGGKKLYGDETIAVRELLQNSIDAIHVYRLLTMQNNLAVGKIKVGVEYEDDNYYLIISDNGIGMNQNILTNELLDFGGSYWKTKKFYNDYKGLHSKGFESIGKYGIGFFSSFMIGKEITVTSWKYGESIDEMKTLDFYDGLMSNPLLRQPTQKEKNDIIDRGTSIRIKLNYNPYEQNGIIYEKHFFNCTLKSLVQNFVPSVDVEITVIEKDGSINTILPNSIEKLNILEIIAYINIQNRQGFYKEKGFEDLGIPVLTTFRKYPLELIEIKNNGELLGKLCILPKAVGLNFTRQDCAIILAKGIRVKSIDSFVGYITTHEVISIKRDETANIVPYDSMREWAKKQIDQIEKLNLQDQYKDRIGDLKIAFDFFSEDFGILKSKKDNIYSEITIATLRDYLRQNKKLVLYGEAFIEKDRSASCEGFINVYHGIDMKDIISETELDKVNNSQKIIRNILKDEWGDFEEKSSQDLFFNVTNISPFIATWTFTKK